MEEVVEQAVDGTVDVVAGRAGQANLGHLAVVSAIAFGAGAGIAWFVSKQHYKRKYEELAEAEIAEAKAFYSRLYKHDEYATPGDAVEALGAGGEAAAEALQQYGAKTLGEVAVEVTEQVDVEVTPVVEPVTQNVFEQRTATDEVWDQDLEEAYRASIGEDEPYIISHMEYNENENDHEQTRLTYFAEDDVLVDDKESPIDAVDMVVGESNLTRFGHGTMDNRIVYIRNHKLSMDFEVVKNDGSYAKQVLGFQHSDKPTIRRMRRDIE